MNFCFIQWIIIHWNNYLFWCSSFQKIGWESLYIDVCVFDIYPWFPEHFITFWPKDVSGSPYTFLTLAQEAAFLQGALWFLLAESGYFKSKTWVLGGIIAVTLRSL